MIVLIESFLTALTISVAAVTCLVSLPRIPNSLRLMISCAGLIAWTVPWSTLNLPLELPGSATTQLWLDSLDSGLSCRGERPEIDRIKTAKSGQLETKIFDVNDLATQPLNHHTTS